MVLLVAQAPKRLSLERMPAGSCDSYTGSTRRVHRAFTFLGTILEEQGFRCKLKGDGKAHVEVAEQSAHPYETRAPGRKERTLWSKGTQSLFVTIDAPQYGPSTMTLDAHMDLADGMRLLEGISSKLLGK
ncbi:hypothetical protein HY988_00155 [Candidatus Micrarchaeota archaeon]|nr:hypothetical protein [Candidatus Micrarchaeota archaeon]